MELSDLEQGANSVACGGYVLNCQEVTGLQVGLTMLKTKEKFPSVFFWGKIFGLHADYYIAYGFQDPEFEFPTKRFFYAGEDFDFKYLPYPSQDKAQKLLEYALEKPFAGKADEVIKPPNAGNAEGDEAPAEGTEEEGTVSKATLTELDRLGQVVVDIDFDTAVVPRGAHRLNEAHQIVPSSDFRGLGATEATALSKYAHFRPPANIAALRALARTDAEFFSNFLDPLESDVPMGCWAVRQDASAGLVTLRSLSWPGYVAYHCPQTTKFGGLYFGYAQKSRDLPFLL